MEIRRADGNGYKDTPDWRGEWLMCCWLIIAFAFAPRVALVVMWLLNDRISQAFGGILLPLIGFFILPWTTLMFVLLAPGGLGTLDVVVLVVALVADVSSWGGGYRYRSR